VREPPDPGGHFGANWLHLGVWFGGRWWRYRQNKHYRSSLDDNQIEQYHLAAALPPAPPGVRWWEAMAVPRRAVQVLELAEGVTLVSLVCEDLAFRTPLLSRRCWPQWTSLLAAATTATWCAPSLARNSGRPRTNQTCQRSPTVQPANAIDWRQPEPTSNESRHPLET
jgi:hypothetical protein